MTVPTPPTQEKLGPDDLTVQRLHYEDGKLDANFGGRVAEVIADAMVALFDENGANNYLEISLLHRATARIFTLTMQLKGAKSPHELREDAEAEVAQLRADGQRLRNQAQAVVKAGWALSDIGHFLPDTSEGHAFDAALDALETVLRELAHKNSDVGAGAPPEDAR